MNLPRSALLDDVAEASLTADVDGLLTLGAAPVSVTLSTQTAAPTVDYWTGTISRTTTDDSISAFLSPLTSREISETPGAQAGDAWLLIAMADATVRPEPHSLATIGSDVWELLDVGVPPLSTHYRSRVRAHA